MVGIPLLVLLIHLFQNFLKFVVRFCFAKPATWFVHASSIMVSSRVHGNKCDRHQNDPSHVLPHNARHHKIACAVVSTNEPKQERMLLSTGRQSPPLLIIHTEEKTTATATAIAIVQPEDYKHGNHRQQTHAQSPRRQTRRRGTLLDGRSRCWVSLQVSSLSLFVASLPSRSFLTPESLCHFVSFRGH